jgi:zinc transporter ZupT
MRHDDDQCIVGRIATGIMVLISLDELIPSAKALASEHTPILGVIVGMILMMVSQYWLE